MFPTGNNIYTLYVNMLTHEIMIPDRQTAKSPNFLWNYQRPITYTCPAVDTHCSNAYISNHVVHVYSNVTLLSRLIS